MLLAVQMCAKVRAFVAVRPLAWGTTRGGGCALCDGRFCARRCLSSELAVGSGERDSGCVLAGAFVGALGVGIGRRV